MTGDFVGKALREIVLADAMGRCGYCRASAEITGAPLEMDHLIPKSRGGPTTRENLWATCRQCNGHKLTRIEASDSQTGTIVPLYNPRRQRWTDHFDWRDGGVIVMGLTPTGRATATALDLNNALAVRAR